MSSGSVPGTSTTHWASNGRQISVTFRRRRSLREAYEPEEENARQEEDDEGIDAQDRDAAQPERQVGMVEGKHADILSKSLRPLEPESVSVGWSTREG